MVQIPIRIIAESAKLTALARVDVVKALQNIRGKYISVGTLHRWLLFNS